MCRMIASIVLLIDFVLRKLMFSMLIQSVFHLAFGKDDVPCLDMPARHTRTSRGTEALALLRGGGRDGKRLARGAEAACLAARAQPANPRPRRRNWIFPARTHGQVSSVD